MKSAPIKSLSLIVLLWAAWGVAQAEPASDAPIPKEKVVALAKKIEAQQARIERNEMEIQRQLAEVTENVRQAWVLSRRASK
jgi:hypothetical protein